MTQSNRFPKMAAESDRKRRGGDKAQRRSVNLYKFAVNFIGTSLSATKEAGIRDILTDVP